VLKKHCFLKQKMGKKPRGGGGEKETKCGPYLGTNHFGQMQVGGDIRRSETRKNDGRTESGPRPPNDKTIKKQARWAARGSLKKKSRACLRKKSVNSSSR